MTSPIEVLITLNHSLSFWIGFAGNLTLIILCFFVHFNRTQKLKIAVAVQGIYCLFLVLTYSVLQLSVVNGDDRTVVVAITGVIVKLPPQVSSWSCYAFYFFYIFDVSTIHITFTYRYTRLYRISWLSSIYQNRYIPILYALFAVYTLVVEYFGISLTSMVYERNVHTVLGTVHTAIVVYNFSPHNWKSLCYVFLFLFSTSFSIAFVMLMGCILIRRAKSRKRMLESELLRRRCTVLLFVQASLPMVTVLLFIFSYFLSHCLSEEHISHSLLVKRLGIELMYWPPAIYPLISVFFLRMVYGKVHSYGPFDEQISAITALSRLELGKRQSTTVYNIVSSTTADPK